MQLNDDRSTNVLMSMYYQPIRYQWRGMKGINTKRCPIIAGIR